MKISQYFTHRPPSKTTLLHDPSPGIAHYHKTRTTRARDFWRRFLSDRKLSKAVKGAESFGLSA